MHEIHSPFISRMIIDRAPWRRAACRGRRRSATCDQLLEEAFQRLDRARCTRRLEEKVKLQHKFEERLKRSWSIIPGVKQRRHVGRHHVVASNETPQNTLDSRETN